jgi:hypothetical protein
MMALVRLMVAAEEVENMAQTKKHKMEECFIS